MVWNIKKTQTFSQAIACYQPGAPQETAATTKQQPASTASKQIGVEKKKGQTTWTARCTTSAHTQNRTKTTKTPPLFKKKTDVLPRHPRAGRNLEQRRQQETKVETVKSPFLSVHSKKDRGNARIGTGKPHKKVFSDGTTREWDNQWKALIANNRLLIQQKNKRKVVPIIIRHW